MVRRSPRSSRPPRTTSATTSRRARPSRADPLPLPEDAWRPAPQRPPRFTSSLHGRASALHLCAGESLRMRRLLGIATAAATLAALALVQGGAAGLNSLGTFFFGPKLVRAEVVTNEGGVIHDYRVDRGRIRQVTQSSLTLFERDGTLVTVPVAPKWSPTKAE